jgi:hypothetical protein
VICAIHRVCDHYAGRIHNAEIVYPCQRVAHTILIYLLAIEILCCQYEARDRESAYGVIQPRDLEREGVRIVVVVSPRSRCVQHKLQLDLLPLRICSILIRQDTKARELGRHCGHCK